MDTLVIHGKFSAFIHEENGNQIILYKRLYLTHDGGLTLNKCYRDFVICLVSEPISFVAISQ